MSENSQIIEFIWFCRLVCLMSYNVSAEHKKTTKKKQSRACRFTLIYSKWVHRALSPEHRACWCQIFKILKLYFVLFWILQIVKYSFWWNWRRRKYWYMAAHTHHIYKSKLHTCTIPPVFGAYCFWCFNWVSDLLDDESILQIEYEFILSCVLLAL